jgi:hypothetical protein
MFDLKKMRIAIESEEHAMKCITELKRLGYHQEEQYIDGVHNFIHASGLDMGFDFWHSCIAWGDLTTLDQLKAMGEK